MTPPFVQTLILLICVVEKSKEYSLANSEEKIKDSVSKNLKFLD